MCSYIVQASLQPARVFYTLKLTSRTRLEQRLIAVQCCEIPNTKLHFGASIITQLSQTSFDILNNEHT